MTAAAGRPTGARRRNRRRFAANSAGQSRPFRDPQAGLAAVLDCDSAGLRGSVCHAGRNDDNLCVDTGFNKRLYYRALDRRDVGGI